MKFFYYLIGLIAAFPSIGTSSGLYSHRVRNQFRGNPRIFKNKRRISNKQDVLSDIKGVWDSDLINALEPLKLREMNLGGDKVFYQPKSPDKIFDFFGFFISSSFSIKFKNSIRFTLTT